jgi:hypothetical protein
MEQVTQHEDPHPNAIGFSLSDYLNLVEWSGRAFRNDYAAL